MNTLAAVSDSITHLTALAGPTTPSLDAGALVKKASRQLAQAVNAHKASGAANGEKLVTLLNSVVETATELFKKLSELAKTAPQQPTANSNSCKDCCTPATNSTAASDATNGTTAQPASSEIVQESRNALSKIERFLDEIAATEPQLKRVATKSKGLFKKLLSAGLDAATLLFPLGKGLLAGKAFKGFLKKIL